MVLVQNLQILLLQLVIQVVQTQTLSSSLLPAQLRERVPVQREMERERSPLVSIPPLRGGDFQGIGVYRSDVFLGRARKVNFRAQPHRLDEPTRLSLGMVASLQSPLPFRLAKSL